MWKILGYIDDIEAGHMEECPVRKRPMLHVRAVALIDDEDGSRISEVWALHDPSSSRLSLGDYKEIPNGFHADAVPEMVKSFRKIDCSVGVPRKADSRSVESLMAENARLRGELGVKNSALQKRLRSVNSLQDQLSVLRGDSTYFLQEEVGMLRKKNKSLKRKLDGIRRGKYAKPIDIPNVHSSDDRFHCVVWKSPIIELDDNMSERYYMDFYRNQIDWNVRFYKRTWQKVGERFRKRSEEEVFNVPTSSLAARRLSQRALTAGLTRSLMKHDLADFFEYGSGLLFTVCNRLNSSGYSDEKVFEMLDEVVERARRAYRAHLELHGEQQDV